MTHPCKLSFPRKEIVDLYVGVAPDLSWEDKLPTDDDDEWYKDHRSFILNYWLPMLRPAEHLWRITAESYISGEEKISDGSTGVPDHFYRFGNIKDPQAILHDYIFQLHHHNRPDAYGHVWTLNEANKAYRDLCLEDGWHIHGWVRYWGLCLVSRFPWKHGTEL